jgi:SET domain-containing protein
MFKETHYRPLPKSVTIAMSSIQGLGLFATEDIPKGTDLGMTHLWFLNQWIRTPLGGFINHAENPNAEAKENTDTVTFRTLVTVMDIKKGEEITFYYTLKEYFNKPIAT